MCKLKPRRVSPRRCQTNPNRPTDIKLLSFNVENLMPKLEEPSFIDLINAHDICLFYETWNKVDEKIGIPDYWDFSQVRPKYKKIGRYSGGITVMVKDDLRSGIKVVHNTEGFIWLKLDKTFLIWIMTFTFVRPTYPLQGHPTPQTKKMIISKILLIKS